MKEFSDPAGLCGAVPGRKFLKHVYLQEARRIADGIDREVQANSVSYVHHERKCFTNIYLHIGARAQPS